MYPEPRKHRILTPPVNQFYKLINDQSYEKKQEVFCFLGALYPGKSKNAVETRLSYVLDFADVALCW